MMSVDNEGGDTAADEIVKVASEIIGGELELVQGCRRLRELQARATWLDPGLFTTFAAVDSETDEFPVGVERAVWDEAARAEKDAELLRYVDIVRPTVEAECRALIDAVRRLQPR